MNARYKETNLLNISYFLRANRHAMGFKDIEAALNYFIELGFVSRSGVRYHITELGKLALSDLDKELRTSHVKFRRHDTGKESVNSVIRKAKKKK